MLKSMSVALLIAAIATIGHRIKPILKMTFERMQARSKVTV